VDFELSPPIIYEGVVMRRVLQVLTATLITIPLAVFAQIKEPPPSPQLQVVIKGKNPPASYQVYYTSFLGERYKQNIQSNNQVVIFNHGINSKQVRFGYIYNKQIIDCHFNSDLFLNGKNVNGVLWKMEIDGNEDYHGCNVTRVGFMKTW